MSQGPTPVDPNAPAMPAASAAAEAEEYAEPSRGFSQWMDTLQPEQPIAAAPAQAPQTQLPEIDSETMAHINARDQRLRQDLDIALRGQANAGQEESMRSEMWTLFQSRYPEFEGADDHIAASFSNVTNGTMALPPNSALRDELMSRVYDDAVDRRNGMVAAAGYEFVDEGDSVANRTAGIEGGSLPDVAAAESSEPLENEGTLSSELVVLQGQTEFYPEASPEVLALYGKNSQR